MAKEWLMLKHTGFKEGFFRSGSDDKNFVNRKFKLRSYFKSQTLVGGQKSFPQLSSIKSFQI